MEENGGTLDLTAPTIIVGGGRSGSTMLTNVLAAHPKCKFLLTETDFLVARLWRDIFENQMWLNSLLLLNDPSRGLRDIRQTIFAEKAEQAKGLVSGVIRNAFCELLGVEGNYTAWGFKEIWNGSAAHTYPWEPYYNVFPGARWIHLIRNPLQFARSSAWHSRSPFTAEYLMDRWNDWADMIDFSRRVKTPENFIEVRYEDIVNTPQETLSKIFDFMGLQLHELCLDAMKERMVPSQKPALKKPEFKTYARWELMGRMRNGKRFASLVHELGYELPKHIELLVAQCSQEVSPCIQAQHPRMQMLDLSGPFLHENERCWIADLPEEIVPGDASQSPQQSRLILFEDGVELCPAHTLHSNIRLYGAGSYSHWERKLFFSTSDNSDPNKNGRKYTVIW